jgi:hypothetical protein
MPAPTLRSRRRAKAALATARAPVLPSSVAAASGIAFDEAGLRRTGGEVRLRRTGRSITAEGGTEDGSSMVRKLSIAFPTMACKSGSFTVRMLPPLPLRRSSFWPVLLSFMLESIPCGMTRAGCSAGLALDEIVEFGNAGRGMPRLCEIREACGLSQAKLADLVGAS